MDEDNVLDFQLFEEATKHTDRNDINRLFEELEERCGEYDTQCAAAEENDGVVFIKKCIKRILELVDKRDELVSKPAHTTISRQQNMKTITANIYVLLLTILFLLVEMTSAHTLFNHVISSDMVYKGANESNTRFMMDSVKGEASIRGVVPTHFSGIEQFRYLAFASAWGRAFTLLGDFMNDKMEARILDYGYKNKNQAAIGHHSNVDTGSLQFGGEYYIDKMNPEYEIRDEGPAGSGGTELSVEDHGRYTERTFNVTTLYDCIRQNSTNGKELISSLIAQISGEIVGKIKYFAQEQRDRRINTTIPVDVFVEMLIDSIYKFDAPPQYSPIYIDGPSPTNSTRYVDRHNISTMARLNNELSEQMRSGLSIRDTMKTIVEKMFIKLERGEYDENSMELNKDIREFAGFPHHLLELLQHTETCFRFVQSGPVLEFLNLMKGLNETDYNSMKNISDKSTLDAADVSKLKDIHNRNPNLFHRLFRLDPKANYFADPEIHEMLDTGSMSDKIDSMSETDSNANSVWFTTMITLSIVFLAVKCCLISKINAIRVPVEHVTELTMHHIVDISRGARRLIFGDQLITSSSYKTIRETLETMRVLTPLPQSNTSKHSQAETQLPQSNTSKPSQAKTQLPRCTTSKPSRADLEKLNEMLMRSKEATRNRAREGFNLGRDDSVSSDDSDDSVSSATRPRNRTTRHRTRTPRPPTPGPRTTRARTRSGK